MRKILNYFGFYNNGKTTVTEKQCDINSTSNLVFDEDFECSGCGAKTVMGYCSNGCDG